MFSLIIGGGAILGHLYIYRRLVRKVAPSRRWRWGLGGLLATFTLALLLRHPIRDLGPGIERAYELASYGWMGLAVCLVVAVAIGDGLHLLHWLVSRLGRRRSDAAPEPQATLEVDASRRRFLGQAVGYGVLAGGVLTTGYGSFRAFARPEVSELAVRLPGLPKTLEGLSIVQLTDIHVGPFIDESFLECLVEVANAERPDLVVVTGDLVDGDVPMLGGAVSELTRLRSRYGTYFVTGNHEYYSGDLQWARFLERIGIGVLRNRRVEIGDAGGSFDLVGVDDWHGARRTSRGYDLDTALAGRDPERAAVLLAHQPRGFDTAVDKGVGLQLSGHTHGGQLFPWTMLVGLAYPYSRGLYRRGDGHIYVSRGCGFWGPPARVGSAPEVVKIHLTA